MAKEIEEKRQKQQQQSHAWPFTSTVTHVVLLDQTGEIVTEITAAERHIPGEVSVEAFRSIARALLEDDLPDSLPKSRYDLGIRLFGVGIREAIRVMAVDAMQLMANDTRPQPTDPDYVPADMPNVSQWYQRSFGEAAWLDPYEAIVPTEHRGNFDVATAARNLCINVDALQTTGPAFAKAELARQLALRAALFVA